MTAKIAVGVGTAVLAGSLAYAAYQIRYIIRHGPNARTPLEAWRTARKERKDLDRALDNILNPKG